MSGAVLKILFMVMILLVAILVVGVDYAMIHSQLSSAQDALVRWNASVLHALLYTLFTSLCHSEAHVFGVLMRCVRTYSTYFLSVESNQYVIVIFKPEYHLARLKTKKMSI
jgi:hypothetical protein